MSDPYKSNGLPDPSRADAACGAPASARQSLRPRRAKAPPGEMFGRGLVAWNALALAVVLVMLVFGGSLGGFFFFAWPFLLALAVRLWVSNPLACLIARG